MRPVFRLGFSHKMDRASFIEQCVGDIWSPPAIPTFRQWHLRPTLEPLSHEKPEIPPPQQIPAGAG
jgi:hypothetical protein